MMTVEIGCVNNHANIKASFTPELMLMRRDEMYITGYFSAFQNLGRGSTIGVITKYYNLPMGGRKTRFLLHLPLQYINMSVRF